MTRRQPRSTSTNTSFPTRRYSDRERDGTTPLYRLQVTLDDQITGLGVRRDDSVTRERRSLRARYQLVALDGSKVVIDDTAGSDAGVDVVGRSEEHTSNSSH